MKILNNSKNIKVKGGDMKLPFKKKSPDPPEGKYLARLIGFEKVYSSIGGIGLRLNFNIIQGKYKNLKISALEWLEKDHEGNPYIPEGSRLENWAVIFTSNNINKQEGTDPKDWIDAEVLIEVKHQKRKKDGRMFANVEDIFHFEKTAKQVSENIEKSAEVKKEDNVKDTVSDNKPDENLSSPDLSDEVLDEEIEKFFNKEDEFN